MSAGVAATRSRDALEPPPTGTTEPPGDVTRILFDWNRGDPEALNELVSFVFADLRRLARKCMGKERVDHTLQPTALVHELFLRLSGQRKVEWENRTQFFSFAVQLMRKVLVDHARRRSTEKRGQGAPRLPLDEALGVPSDLGVELEALDSALSDLARLDPRQCRVVELRFFVGLSVDEVREVLGCSRATVIRDWRTAKLWLLRYLRSREGEDER